MKIGVISDTHGDRRSIERAVARVGTTDFWLHAGDHGQDSRSLVELTGLPVVSVTGNCDGRTEAKPDEFLEFEGYRIWLTHGHRNHVREGHADLLFWARKYEVQAVIYGHTHIPEVHWEQDLLIFNPGSASRPRGGFPASCGLLIVSSQIITPQLIEL
ncbi:phosphodiesterase [Anaerosporomusa subterranea]|uniref:Phosphoesterase n=1 Tax=Anaerosporomusa subterranea TaxID=1794912 RepID=A0A154BRT8_ANASB|nr:metallophosphoesterase [Anaerosporomusa subterranea]KYZ76651.1 phosphodiesterase [Anaerosporomusa subterranea]